MEADTPPASKTTDENNLLLKPTGKWCKKHVIMSFIENEFKKSFNDFSPFKVCKCIKSYAPNVGIKFLRNGTVLLNISTEKDFINIQNMKTFENIPLLLELHRSLNFSKGVVYVPELVKCSEKEIELELQAQGVVKVFRITKNVNNTRIPTPTLIITFEKPETPDKITFDFLQVKVRPYIPNPMQCYSCFRFRHTSKYCKTKNCGKCGDLDHDTNTCQSVLKCINCGEAHPAYDRNCKTYLREKEIETIRSKEKVSFRQAELLFKQRNVPHTPLNVTFSQAINKSNTLNNHTSNQPIQSIEPLTQQINKLTEIVEKLLNKFSHLENVTRPETPSNSQLVITVPSQKRETTKLNITNSSTTHLNNLNRSSNMPKTIPENNSQTNQCINKKRPASQGSSSSNCSNPPNPLGKLQHKLKKQASS